MYAWHGARGRILLLLLLIFHAQYYPVPQVGCRMKPRGGHYLDYTGASLYTNRWAVGLGMRMNVHVHEATRMRCWAYRPLWPILAARMVTTFCRML